MVDIAGITPPTSLRITVRPNCAANRREHVAMMRIIIPVAMLIGLVFFSLGAWLVVPFVALALLGLVIAFHAVQRHAGDYERITLAGDRLVVERHKLEQDEHFEFNGCWVQVICHRAVAGGCAYLALRSHGRELVLGRDLTDAERAWVGETLLDRLARIQR